VGLAIGVKS